VPASKIRSPHELGCPWISNFEQARHTTLHRALTVERVCLLTIETLVWLPTSQRHFRTHRSKGPAMRPVLRGGGDTGQSLWGATHVHAVLRKHAGAVPPAVTTLSHRPLSMAAFGGCLQHMQWLGVLEVRLAGTRSLHFVVQTTYK
jgi:hypothetical protein